MQLFSYRLQMLRGIEPCGEANAVGAGCGAILGEGEVWLGDEKGAGQLC